MDVPVAKKSGVVVPQKLKWHQRLAAGAIIFSLRLVMKTWRYTWIPKEPELDTYGPVIFCLWHNRLLLSMATYQKYVKARWPATGLAAMISASRDGGMLSSVVEHFGLQPIRGSTSRRGPQALLEATSWMEKNYGVAITPDGPRGPVYKIQPGIILLAQLTGRPIMPVSNHVRWKIRLGSWDGFQIPLPFARCELTFGEPILVPRDASEAQQEQIRQQLEQAMHAITKD